MTSVYDLKPAFQRLLRPASARLHGAGVTPNQITVAALVASIGVGFWLVLARNPVFPLVALPVFLLFRMAANALDGMMARAYNLRSRAGAVLNEVGDVIADAALYLPFATLPGIRPLLVVAITLLGATTEVAGLAGAAAGGVRRNDGPMGKSDRALAFGVFATAYAAGLRAPRVWDAALGVVLILLLATIVNRCRSAMREGP